MDYSDRLVANLFFLFKEYAHADRFAAAARAGFKWVEDPWPYDLPLTDFKAALEASGARLAMINTPVGDPDRGDFGLGARPGREDDFRAGFETALDYAEVAGAPVVHVMVGDVPQAEREGAEATLIANLKWASGRAADQGRRLVIETINTVDRPDWFVSLTPHAERIIDAVGADNLGLLFDIYHVHKMNEDVRGRIAEIPHRITHVQVASLPQRHEPVGGAIPLETVLSDLDAVGYDGFVSGEYNPATTTEAGIGWIEAYGARPR